MSNSAPGHGQHGRRTSCAPPVSTADGPNPLDNAGLTAQQRQIAELAAAGLSNKQIAERLFLSPRTVGYHLTRPSPKLGVTSRAALRDALADLPD